MNGPRAREESEGRHQERATNMNPCEEDEQGSISSCNIIRPICTRILDRATYHYTMNVNIITDGMLILYHNGLYISVFIGEQITRRSSLLLYLVIVCGPRTYNTCTSITWVFISFFAWCSFVAVPRIERLAPCPAPGLRQQQCHSVRRCAFSLRHDVILSLACHAPKVACITSILYARLPSCVHTGCVTTHIVFYLFMIPPVHIITSLF